MHTHASPTSPSRRDFFKSAALAAGAVSLLGTPLARAAAPVSARRARALRIAHLTDIHVQPERHAADGLAAVLRHVQSLPDKPSLILTGGDHIMDSFGRDEARTKLQWELLRTTFKDENGIPVEHTLGNHDIWGWNKTKSRTSGNEPMWGKKWALDQFGLAKTYHSFDKAGWHFICLDSIATDPNNPDGYIGRLGEQQLDWLARDLDAVNPATPVLVISHIPILTVTGILGNPDKTSNDFNCSGGTMHTDSLPIREVFAKHPNVKLCLSGHTHRLDRVEFRGVSYLCNGAVSGNWWKGAHFECTEGYALLDLFTDGSFECQYLSYGWQAQE